MKFLPPYPTLRSWDQPQIEAQILTKWMQEDTFQQSLTLREGSPTFVFYEGPPGTNGTPGIHHVISRVIKDLFCRYKTQRGYYVTRKAGWDTHGLPVELNVEKCLGITKEDIGRTISVADYNKKCSEDVFTFKHRWEEMSRFMGYWLDLDNPYITCNTDYIESVWWVLQRLYDKGYLYKSWSIQPYSPAAGTGLSTHELNQPGAYKMVKDTTVTAMFRLEEEVNRAHSLYASLLNIAPNVPIYCLAWTTTPWTLPSNLGLAVAAQLTYVLLRTCNPYTKEEVLVILAADRVSAYLNEGEGEVLLNFQGSDLCELRYLPLFTTTVPKEGDPFRVVAAPFVSAEDGTGIVHIAPAFGADDYQVGCKEHLGMLTLVDREGKFTEGAGEWAGRYVKNYKEDAHYQDPNVDICVVLKKRGQAFRIEKYEHSYPHCWRTGKPILYYPMEAWFVNVREHRERLMQLNDTIKWLPESTGVGRFGKWLENVQDWNLSRSRFWGTPLPIWRTEDGKETCCIGSIEALKEGIRRAAYLNPPSVTEAATLDLHKPWVDDVVLLSPTGRPMRREPDLVDVWLDSGAMPYAQWHYPFENKELFKTHFPADFVCEGVDQTRGYFYTLHVLAALLFDKVAFKTVISNGLVLDKNGEKMSKRLGNTIDPFVMMQRYGADPLRWYLITNASPWDNLRFDEKGIQEVQRKFFGTLFNTYQFFALYANLDGFAYPKKPILVADRPLMDRWILSVLNSMIVEVRSCVDAYDATTAYRKVEQFVIDELSNWYVRLCRKRFWKQDNGHDKQAAYQTLYECLLGVSVITAPIIPFFAEWLYGALTVNVEGAKASVHHTDFMEADPNCVCPDLEDQMRLAQEITSSILSIRKVRDIKVRQPLLRILLPEDFRERVKAVADIILLETNVKEIVYVSTEATFVKKTVQANFSVLGKKLGKKMNAVAVALRTLNDTAISTLEKEKQLTLSIEGSPIVIHLEEVVIKTQDMEGWAVAQRKDGVVALDLQISEDLRREGNARELVNKIQNLRKEKDFLLTDRIVLRMMAADTTIIDSVRQYETYITSELLCTHIEFIKEVENGFTLLDINGSQVKVDIAQV